MRQHWLQMLNRQDKGWGRGHKLMKRLAQGHIVGCWHSQEQESGASPVQCPHGRSRCISWRLCATYMIKGQLSPCAFNPIRLQQPADFGPRVMMLPRHCSPPSGGCGKHGEEESEVSCLHALPSVGNPPFRIEFRGSQPVGSPSQGEQDGQRKVGRQDDSVPSKVP